MNKNKEIVPVTKILTYFGYKEEDIKRLPLITIHTLIFIYYNK